MKIYFLAPHSGNDWLSPRQVADRFLDEFGRVEVDAEAAEKEGHVLLTRYRRILEAGLGTLQSTSIDELEKRWTGALSIAVPLDNAEKAWFRTTACNAYRLELFFSPEVSTRQQRPLAMRAAKALDYAIESIDGD